MIRIRFLLLLLATLSLALAAGAAQAGNAVDSDGDGTSDIRDNCVTTFNEGQLDSDNDGVGNACDGDYNNDGQVDATDEGIFQAAFGTSRGDPGYNEATDHNGDGQIAMPDFLIISGQHSASE